MILGFYEISTFQYVWPLLAGNIPVCIKVWVSQGRMQKDVHAKNGKAQCHACVADRAKDNAVRDTDGEKEKCEGPFTQSEHNKLEPCVVDGWWPKHRLVKEETNVLRKHARRTASATVSLRRWEGNMVVRGQQEREGGSIRVTLRDSERSSKRFRPWTGRWVLHCMFRARTCYRPNYGSLQQRKAGNKGKSQRSFLKFHIGLRGPKLEAINLKNMLR